MHHLIHTVLYVMDGERFLEIIGSDFFTFRHFFDNALQRFRFNKKMRLIHEQQRIKLGMKVKSQAKCMKLADLALLLVAKRFQGGELNVRNFFAQLEVNFTRRFEQQVREKIAQSYFFRPLLKLKVPQKILDQIHQMVHPTGLTSADQIRQLFRHFERHIKNLAK